MTIVEGFFYKKNSSKQYSVSIQLVSSYLRVTGKDVGNFEYLVDDLTIEPRVGKTSQRSITFPDGGLIEFHGDALIDSIFDVSTRSNKHNLLYRLETKWRYVTIAFAVMVGCIWAFFSIGIPIIAKTVAYNLPVEVDMSLGQHTLYLLDKTMLKPSKLDNATQLRLRTHFKKIAEQSQDKRKFSLKFRAAGFANAFALPNGVVIMTDDLVELAKNDNELVSILAHEVGHIVHRHGLRMVLQDAAVGLLVTIYLGDISAGTILSSSLPTFYLQAKYSRAFETEADKYSLTYLQKNNISPMVFVTIMKRLAAQDKLDEHKDGEDKQGKIPELMSSHPLTKNRIKMFIDASKQSNK